MVGYAGKVKATAKEREYMARVKQLPCCVCLPNEQSTPTEVHHITEGMRRVGNFYCLPLCRVHHANVHRLGRIEVRRLWDWVNQTLGIERTWIQSKVLPR